VQALEREGYAISRVPGIRKGSVRRITKEGCKPMLAAIKTMRNADLAFDPKPKNGFTTLDEVDVVIAVTTDDRQNPRFAYVHKFDAKLLRPYFYRAREARTAAGQPPSTGVGMWLKLYGEEDAKKVWTIGAGFGLTYPPIDKVPLVGEAEQQAPERVQMVSVPKDGGAIQVDVGHVRITIEIGPAA
jgi:hypothetical protein